MTTMHTFSNFEYDKIRHDLLNRNNPIAVSDVKNN